ncbi:hypothetical protein KHM83_09335 [Fusibacter paucivorans]|uniref:Uncharacterized protein n=1 Tax=Fusibacter paucivorans TaxID=76009 RepID=A0ABS5PR39_9FIRM|nr:hypothetical protein [Fusibacter paucivorans]MBS7526879.1 hypothetical protein [Fusibacter paucivorans]
MKLMIDDMDRIMGDWQTNPHVTVNQRSQWPKSIKKKYLGNDAADSLRLLEADGFDDSFVFDQPHKIVKRCWYTNEYHWPQIEAIMRFGQFFHIGVTRTLILVVKCFYEQYCRIALKKARNCGGIGELYAIGTQYTKAFTADFEAMHDLKTLYDVFEETWQTCGENSIYEDGFNNLMKHILTSRIYLFGTETIEIEQFSQDRAKELAIENQNNRTVVIQYEALKMQWLNKLTELDNLLLSMEKLRLTIAQTKQQWMAEFGESYIDILDRRQKLNRRRDYLQIKDDEPHLTEAEINQKILQREKASKQKIAAAKDSFRWAMTLKQYAGINLHSEMPSEKEQKQYLYAYKKCLREIYLKTHPDAMLNHAFTKEQVKVLEALYKETIVIRDQELAYDTRSLMVLEDILERVKLIWRHMGIDIEPEVVLEGNDLNSLSDDIGKKTDAIEKKETQIKNEMFLLANDPVYIEKRENLVDARAIRRQHEKMNAEIERLNQQLESAL